MALEKFLGVGMLREAFFQDVGFEVVGVEADRVTEAEGHKLVSFNEEVNEREAEVQDLGSFFRIEQTRLLRRSMDLSLRAQDRFHVIDHCIPQASVEGRGGSLNNYGMMR